MNPYYIVKQALKQQDQIPMQRYVHPLAQIIGQQMGVNPESLKNRDMEAAMAQLTDYARGTGSNGSCNTIARNRTMPSQDNNIERILNSDCLNGRGPGGTLDLFNLQHKIVNPTKWKGEGQNVLSMNKFQNLFNPENIGKLGRNGGQSLS